MTSLIRMCDSIAPASEDGDVPDSEDDSLFEFRVRFVASSLYAHRFVSDIPQNVRNNLRMQQTMGWTHVMAKLRSIKASNVGLDRIVKCYEFLAKQAEIAEITNQFAMEPLIYVNGSWKSSGECMWKDASGVFFRRFAYLENVYPTLEVQLEY